MLMTSPKNQLVSFRTVAQHGNPGNAQGMSKDNKVYIVFKQHLRSQDRGYWHFGTLLVVEGSKCTIKSHTGKAPNSRFATDVFATEESTWVAFILFHLLMVHNRPLCIQNLTPDLLFWRCRCWNQLHSDFF